MPTVDELIKRPYSRVLTPDENGGYVADVLEIPDCFSEGDTADEAMENLEDAMRAWFEIALEDGLSIPEPLESGDYNGRILLRTPKYVHRECVRRAQFDGVSLNQWLLEAISERLGAQVLFDRLVSSFHRTPSYAALVSHDIVTGYASMRQTITVPLVSGITILGSPEIGTITEPSWPGVLGQAIWQRSGPKEEVNA